MITAAHARKITESTAGNEMQPALTALDTLVSIAAAEGRSTLTLRATDFTISDQLITVLQGLGYNTIVTQTSQAVGKITLDWSAQ
jgi:hypothetical protein